MDYKEKLEEAKRLYQTANSDQRYVLENLFPELKESEDEKIRKYLLKLADRCPEDSIDFMRGVKKGDIIAWLEKQGKQKVSYTTIVETGDGGINALVTGELPIDGEQKPIEFKWSKKFTISKKQLLAWLEKPDNPNPYSGTSFKHNGHTWGMCARDCGVDLMLDGKLRASFNADGDVF